MVAPSSEIQRATRVPFLSISALTLFQITDFEMKLHIVLKSMTLIWLLIFLLRFLSSGEIIELSDAPV